MNFLYDKVRVLLRPYLIYAVATIQSTWDYSSPEANLNVLLHFSISAKVGEQEKTVEVPC